MNLGALGTGIPTLTAPAGVGTGAVAGIAVQGLLSNSKRLDAGGNYVVGDTAIMPKLERTGGGGTLTFESLKRPWENGNNIYIRMYDSGAAQVPKAIATVEGTLDGSGNPSGPVTINISLSNGGGGIDATHSDVIGAITGTAATLVSASSTVTTATAFEIEDATDATKGQPLEGGVDSESFAILQSTWNAFFTGTDRLDEGDVLVFTFPDAEARRKQGGSPESTLRVIRRSENVDNANVVPICKVIQDSLIFINGTIVTRGETVRLLPDQHLRNDLTDDSGADAGDRLIGADTKPGGTASLVQGTVYSQMTSMLAHHNALDGEYNDHVAGVADKHYLSQILAKPFVTVSPTAGHGDYTTIQAAINAIAADDTMTGVVYIKYKAGGYTEGLSFTGLGDRSITLIGEDRNQVSIYSTGATPALTISAMDPNDSIEFVNLGFTSGLIGASQHIAITANMPYDRQKVVFRGCEMGRGAVGTPRMLYVTGSPRIEFHECLLDGNAYDDTTGWGDIDSDDGPTITIKDCRVTNAQHLLVYKSSGSAPGYLSFCNNEIYKCGYNKSDGTTLTAILHAETLGISMAGLNITGNRWKRADVAEPHEISGALTYLNGPGVIANNVLKQPVFYAPTAVRAVIHESSGHTTVTANHIESGKCMTVFGAGPINGNSIYDFQGGAANMPAIFGAAGAAVVGNKIFCSTATPPVCDEIIDLNGSQCLAEGNNIRYAPAVIGINVNDSYSTVTGNTIEFNTAGTGIACPGSYGAITGNTINSAALGVHVTGDYVVLSGNRVGKGTSNYGIHIGATAVGCSVNGNVIHSSGTMGTGILVEGDFNAINGNMVFQCSLGIDVDGDSNTICGNMVNDPLNFCCDISGSYNTVVGNRWRNVGSGTLNDTGTENGVAYESWTSGPVNVTTYNNAFSA